MVGLWATLTVLELVYYWVLISSIQAILDILSALDMSEVQLGCTVERVAMEGCWFQGDNRVAQSQSPSQALRYEKLMRSDKHC